MSEQKPFAVLAQERDWKPGEYVMCVVGGYLMYSSTDMARVVEDVDHVNAIHDEAVKATAEAFRERAAKVAEEYAGTQDNEWNRRSGFFDSADIAGDDIANAIRALPVEEPK